MNHRKHRWQRLCLQMTFTSGRNTNFKTPHLSSKHGRRIPARSVSLSRWPLACIAGPKVWRKQRAVYTRRYMKYQLNDGAGNRWIFARNAREFDLHVGWKVRCFELCILSQEYRPLVNVICKHLAVNMLQKNHRRVGLFRSFQGVRTSWTRNRKYLSCCRSEICEPI